LKAWLEGSQRKRQRLSFEMPRRDVPFPCQIPQTASHLWCWAGPRRDAADRADVRDGNEARSGPRVIRTRFRGVLAWQAAWM